MILEELSEECEEQLQEREGYGGRWLGESIRPQYGMLGRRSRIRKVFRDLRIEDEEIEGDLCELANMFGRNQLGCQESQCACGEANEFARGEEVAGSLLSGRMVRRSIIDMDAIRRRSESDLRSRRKEDGISTRIINGRRGEDLVNMAKKTGREMSMPDDGCPMREGQESVRIVMDICDGVMSSKEEI